jgi:hypothetical protein
MAVWCDICARPCCSRNVEQSAAGLDKRRRLYRSAMIVSNGKRKRNAKSIASSDETSGRGMEGIAVSACSIRVSTQGFARIVRELRKRESLKFFVFNNRQWCESHPLRHSKQLKQNDLFIPVL